MFSFQNLPFNFLVTVGQTVGDVGLESCMFVVGGRHALRSESIYSSCALHNYDYYGILYAALPAFIRTHLLASHQSGISVYDTILRYHSLYSTATTIAYCCELIYN